MTRAGRLVLVALALAGWPVAAASGAVTEPELVAPDPAAAMGVPIVGATGPEHVAAFAGVAAVPDAGVRKVVFFDQGKRRALRVVLARPPLRPEADPREYWLAHVVASAIAQPLEAGDHPIRWIEVGPDAGGSATGPETWTSRTPEELAAVGRDLTARSAAAGWEVVELRAWPTGAGAIAITLRLTERGLLDGRADWSTTLFGGPWSYAHLLRIEAPDGSLIEGGGSIGTNGGFGRGPSTGSPSDVPPPPDLTGPTRLELGISDPPYLGGPTRRFSYVLDCDGGTSTGIADVAATCARVIGDRYALLPPVAPNIGCLGEMGEPAMGVRGTFLGVPVERQFGSCHGATVDRWMTVLRIPPESPLVSGPNDPYGASLVRIVGGTPAERRAGRVTIRGASSGIVERVTFTRRAGRRVVTVEPRRPDPYAETREADVAWVADVVRREIERRLHGQDAATFERYRGRRLQSRAGTLLSRATRAGWYVRSVQGWNLGPGGTFIVTLRLSERELLDGRTGWVEDIAADRDRERYGVRFDVEAPDGTLVAGGGETFPLGHAPAPPGIDGPTRLEVDATRVAGDVRRTFVLDCDGGASIGIGDPAGTCSRLLADRYALLAPVDNPHCAAAGLVNGVVLRGTFRGVRIDRNYFACEPRSVDRWLRLLDLP